LEIWSLVVQYDVPSARAKDWATTLFKHVQPKCVVMLDTLFPHQYRTATAPGELVPPLLRVVHSAAETKRGLCPRLEPPNFLQKVSAAVVSHCERVNIPCSVYLSLEESIDLREPTLRAFDRAFTAHLQLTPPSNLAQRLATVLARPTWKRPNSMFL